MVRKQSSTNVSLKLSHKRSPSSTHKLNHSIFLLWRLRKVSLIKFNLDRVKKTKRGRFFVSDCASCSFGFSENNSARSHPGWFLQRYFKSRAGKVDEFSASWPLSQGQTRPNKLSSLFSASVSFRTTCSAKRLTTSGCLKVPQKLSWAWTSKSTSLALKFGFNIYCSLSTQINASENFAS